MRGWHWRARAVGSALMVAGTTACAGAAGQDGAISLEPVVEGLEQPVFVTHADDGSGRLFIIEQPGRVRILQDGELARAPFLDLEDRIECCGEQGLLGLAFHPDFPDDPRFFVNYTRAPDGATVVSEFQVGPDGRPAGGERVLLTIPQPWGNHNGGMFAFGPDGLLYVGMGDGGSGGDPQNNGQDPDALLGKMLRIDVDEGEPYGIPEDNPYADGGGAPEIYAIGLRNPWRFSFDRQSGELWAGDVGQNAIEEVDRIERGGNYGWRLREGTQPFEPTGSAGNLIPPVVEYAHEGGRCSVTGGYVYHGQAAPDLQGTYVYADYCSGEILGFADGEQQVLLESGLSVSSFGEDEAGELYVVDHDGAIYQVTGPAS